MRDLIKILFNLHNFQLIELEFGDLYISNDDRKYYWLVVEQSDLSKVIELQDEWFEKCKEHIVTKEFDKNTSLLVLANNDKNEIQKKEILSIEEDPFQFKKYVLLFTSHILKQLLEQTENGNPEKILELIVNESVFNEYKNNYLEPTWRHLLYNLAHKLPFIKINVEVNQTLENLFEEAEKTLVEKGLLEYSAFIEKQHEKDMFSNLDSLDIDELIELLDNKTENGN
ncbi:ABC-three component system middle component 1 [Lacinutrix gracilariae]|uniref:ABC-three component system middle component 1 n=1 Tax=Lacinutrix gracilariae TaxID=1747198 RepID=A0ABW5JZ77_9FLAO